MPSPHLPRFLTLHTELLKKGIDMLALLQECLEYIVHQHEFLTSLNMVTIASQKKYEALHCKLKNEIMKSFNPQDSQSNLKAIKKEYFHSPTRFQCTSTSSKIEDDISYENTPWPTSSEQKNGDNTGSESEESIAIKDENTHTGTESTKVLANFKNSMNFSEDFQTGMTQLVNIPEQGLLPDTNAMEDIDEELHLEGAGSPNSASSVESNGDRACDKPVTVKDKPFKCEICQKSYGEKRFLRSHMVKHSIEKPFKCELCDYKCKRKCSLKAHMVIHAKEKAFTCEICEYKCAWKSSLIAHMLIHKGERAFKCDMCNRRFLRKTHLQRHMLTHTGEKRFQCELCDEKFAQKADMKKHMLKHTQSKQLESSSIPKGPIPDDEKPFECKLCEKKFLMKYHLKQHMLVHTGEKPFECVVCEKRFTQRGNMETHMLIHTGVKPFECDVCNKKFAQKGNLDTHKKRHIGKKPIECIVCCKKFYRKAQLTGHYCQVPLYNIAPIDITPSVFQ